VTVSDGVVHVWGVIDSDRRRRALVVAAENIPGVKRVEDHTARTVAIDPMNRPNWPTPAPP
jgi:osmotically-inducible protein OsmY